MLTNNFYQAMRSYLSETALSSVLRSPTNSSMNCYFEISSTSNILTAFGNNSCKVVTSDAGGMGMAFGTGTVPPSRDDYWLSGDLIKTVTILARSAQSSLDDGFLCCNNALTLKNTSDTDTIVINEMGVCGYAYTASGRTGGYVMWDRTVLDTPLTLAPGEQGVITYTFNLPIVQ